jgi:hypothetical protein
VLEEAIVEILVGLILLSLAALAGAIWVCGGLPKRMDRLEKAWDSSVPKRLDRMEILVDRQEAQFSMISSTINALAATLSGVTGRIDRHTQLYDRTLLKLQEEIENLKVQVNTVSERLAVLMTRRRIDREDDDAT